MFLFLLLKFIYLYTSRIRCVEPSENNRNGAEVQQQSLLQMLQTIINFNNENNSPMRTAIASNPPIDSEPQIFLVGYAKPLDLPAVQPTYTTVPDNSVVINNLAIPNINWRHESTDTGNIGSYTRSVGGRKHRLFAKSRSRIQARPAPRIITNGKLAVPIEDKHPEQIRDDWMPYPEFSGKLPISKAPNFDVRSTNESILLGNNQGILEETCNEMRRITTDDSNCIDLTTTPEYCVDLTTTPEYCVDLTTTPESFIDLTATPEFSMDLTATPKSEMVQKIHKHTYDALKLSPPYSDIVVKGRIMKGVLEQLIDFSGLAKNKILKQAYLRATQSKNPSNRMNQPDQNNTSEMMVHPITLKTMMTTLETFWVGQRNVNDIRKQVYIAVYLYRILIQTESHADKKDPFGSIPYFTYFILGMTSIKKTHSEISLMESLTNFPARDEDLATLDNISAEMYFTFDSGCRSYSNTFRNTMIALNDSKILNRYLKGYKLKYKSIINVEKNTKYFLMHFRALTHNTTIAYILQIIDNVYRRIMNQTVADSNEFVTIVNLFENTLYDIMRDIVPTGNSSSAAALYAKIYRLNHIEQLIRTFYVKWLREFMKLDDKKWLATAYKMHTSLIVFLKVCQKLSRIFLMIGNFEIFNMDSIKLEEVFESIISTAIDPSRFTFLINAIRSSL